VRNSATIIITITGIAKIVPIKSVPPALEKKIFTAVSRKVGILMKQFKHKNRSKDSNSKRA
jgi:hypothetical protein